MAAARGKDKLATHMTFGASDAERAAALCNDGSASCYLGIMQALPKWQS